MFMHIKIMTWAVINHFGIIWSVSTYYHTLSLNTLYKQQINSRTYTCEIVLNMN